MSKVISVQLMHVLKPMMFLTCVEDLVKPVCVLLSRLSSNPKDINVKMTGVCGFVRRLRLDPSANCCSG